MLHFNKFFPAEIYTLITDNRVDFALPKEGEPFNAAQKKFLSAQLKKTAANITTIRQIHGKRVILTSPQYIREKKISKADAAITDRAGFPISVRTADCLSVFIYDPKNKAIGLVHAGWKGTYKQVTANTVAAMKKKFSSRPQDLLAAFGPSIRPCCYQVGPEFKKFFPKEIAQKPGGLYLDVPLVNRRQLLNLGVREKNIFDINKCTYCDKSFFSYRREGEEAGRMLCVMMLKHV